MARDNRKDNREAAKKAGNENKAPDGTDFSDMLKDDEYSEEEDVQEIENQENDEENEENDENAAKSEAELAAAKAVEKKAEEEGKGKASDDKSKDDDDKADEVAKGEKTAEELKAEEEAKKLEQKPEPTAEEKKALEDEAKAKADAEKAEAEAKAKAKAETEKASDTSKPLSNEEAAKLFSDWRGETETLLAEHVYKLTEENVAELNENPAAFIPKAMSRVYLDSISAAFQQFVTYLPRMVSQVLEQQAIIKEQDDEFFGAWPQLKSEKGRETVIRLGSAYRSQNPGATKEDFVNEVGAQAMVALRLTPEPAKANGDANKANGADDGKQKPFKPASNAPASSSEKPKPTNPYDQLAQEFGRETEEEVDDN